MTEDLALLIIGSLVAGKLVAMLLGARTRDHGPYVALLAADLVALFVVHSSRVGDGALAFTAECAGVILAVVPTLLDGLEARFARRDTPAARRFTLLASRVREIVMPGRAATQHRRQREQQISTRAGDAERTIETLREELSRAAGPEEAEHIHAEIVQLMLATGRLAPAAEHARRHLSLNAYRRSPTLTAAMSMALSEMGHPREAVQLLALLESEAPSGSPSSHALLTMTRLAFVAGAGSAEHITQLLDTRAIAGALSPDSIAKVRAIAAVAQARDPGMRDAEAAVVAEALAREMLERAKQPAPVLRRAPVTLAIIAVNVAVWVLMLCLHVGDESLDLARAGALFRPAVVAGEWWRIGTAMFLHVGLIHLVMTMLPLYLIGRITEALIGGARLFIIYVLAGIGGGLATLWADPSLSMGSSGALMGVLAALTVVVFARRDRVHPAAHRLMFGTLLFVVGLQIFLAWQAPLVDSAAHAGGYIAGLFATAGLLPDRDTPSLDQRWLRVVAVLLALGLVAAGVLQARCPLERTLARLPLVGMDAGAVHVDVPSSWHKVQSGLIVDRHLGIELRVDLDGKSLNIRSPQIDDPRVRPLLDRIGKSAHPASQNP